MRRIIFLVCFIASLTAGTVMAADIDGRLGITGKVGFAVPLQDDFITGATDSKTGLAAGGGLIYGLSKNLAAELDITQVPTIDLEVNGSKVGEAAFTDVSLGLQYRFTPDNRLVPYLGAGVDFITGDFQYQSGQKFDFEWTTGGHINAGVDYFLNRGVALTAEIKGVFAPKGDVKGTASEYDPTSFLGAVGVRLFLPENLFR